MNFGPNLFDNEIKRITILQFFEADSFAFRDQNS